MAKWDTFVNLFIYAVAWILACVFIGTTKIPAEVFTIVWLSCWCLYRGIKGHRSKWQRPLLVGVEYGYSTKGTD